MDPIYSPDTVITRQMIENAIAKGEIIPYYQPKYNAITGKLQSAEALARWVQADGSIIPPNSFIPVAEEDDLIRLVDRVILEQVCAFLQKRRRENHRCVPVSVNFSRSHFTEEAFCMKLCEIVDSYEIPHDLIEVELTESAVMNDPETVIVLVSELRDCGFDVAIDDFGSGFSSLALVRDLAANVLKIDRSLLSGNCESEKERILLESIFTLAHRLKLTTVAEGVETREQLEFLRTCDCNLIQGYLFAKSMPAEDFAVACSQRFHEEYKEDILVTQPHARVMNMLMEVLFDKFPLVIMSNLTRDSFYMLAYDNYSSTSCPATGVYSELIAHAATTIHPEDRHIFEEDFSVENHYIALKRGDRYIRAVLRQMGDDGEYHKVEMTDYFFTEPSVDDVLVVTVSQNLPE